MGHVNTNPLPEGAGYCVGGVDPAVSVQHVLGDVLGVDTVDRVPDVLPGGDDQREGEEEGDGGGVVQAEDAGVRGDSVLLDKALQTTK